VIFRYLLRRRCQQFDRRFFPPEYCLDKLQSGGYDWITALSEWHAFRRIFFPMSVIHEMDPKHLRELKRILENALEGAPHDEKKSSA